MDYTSLIMLAEEEGIDILEHEFNNIQIKGLYVDNTITLNSHIQTVAEKKCVLAEELGHHYITHGDIIDQKNTINRKQEILARGWSYEKLLPIHVLIDAYSTGVRNQHELAEHLELTEEFISEALEYYKSKHGLHYRIDNYIISLDNLDVINK